MFKRFPYTERKQMIKSIAGVVMCMALAGWRGQAEDNVCGISTLPNVVNPAVIDWTGVMNITKEVKLLKKEGIDRNSARGKLLIAEATNKVARASNAIMLKTRVDSVWKKISHATKKPLDITQRVKNKIQGK